MFREELKNILIKLFQKKIAKGGTFSNPSTKPPLPWYQNQTKLITKIKLQAKITNEHRCKNPPQNTIKQNPTIHWRIIQHDQMWFIPGMWEFFNKQKTINVTHHMRNLKDKNHMIISIDVEETWQNSTPIYD